MSTIGCFETFEKYSILFKVKAGENFNRRIFPCFHVYGYAKTPLMEILLVFALAAVIVIVVFYGLTMIDRWIKKAKQAKDLTESAPREAEQNKTGKKAKKAKKPDPKQTADPEELLISEAIQSEAIINILDKKGIVSKKEVFDEIKKLSAKAPKS